MSAQQTARAPKTCRVIDFQDAQIHVGINPGQPPYLTVAGEKPSRATEVSLHPVEYIRQPEYWEWEVVGCSGVDIQVMTHFAVTVQLKGNIGTKGIVVVGATESKQFDVSGG